MEPREETPIEAVIEMCVYAPLGFALEARSLLPRFVERGRNQVAMARVVGKFAARKGRESFEGRVDGSHSMVMGLLELTGVVSGPGEDTDASGGRDGSRPSASGNGTAGGAMAGSGSRNGSVTSARGDRPGARVVVAARGAQTSTNAPEAVSDAPEESDLAIPGYGSLAASQVVPRLASLNVAELDAVRRYETAHRARRTILNRISQLQSS